MHTNESEVPDSIPRVKARTVTGILILVLLLVLTAKQIGLISFAKYALAIVAGIVALIFISIVVVVALAIRSSNKNNDEETDYIVEDRDTLLEK